MGKCLRCVAIFIVLDTSLFHTTFFCRNIALYCLSLLCRHYYLAGSSPRGWVQLGFMLLFFLSFFFRLILHTTVYLFFSLFYCRRSTLATCFFSSFSYHGECGGWVVLVQARQPERHRFAPPPPPIPAATNKPEIFHLTVERPDISHLLSWRAPTNRDWIYLKRGWVKRNGATVNNCLRHNELRLTTN